MTIQTKKIIAIVLAVLVVAGAGVGIAVGINNQNPSNSSQIQSSQQSSESSSQSSSQSNSSSSQDQLTKIEFPELKESLTSNVDAVNLKDVYLLMQGDTAVIGKTFDGLNLGTIACSLLGEELQLGYYSDGNWYSKNSKGELKKCHKVLRVIFNYQFGSGKPIELSQSDLQKYGKDTLITYFEDQFEMEDISSTLEKLPSNLMPGLIGFAKRLMQITVKDVYDLSNGDYTYIETFIKETDVDEVIDLIFDITTFVSEENYDGMRPVLKEVLNGKVNEIEIDGSVTVNKIINAYPSTDDFTNAVKIEIMNLYKRVTLDQLKQATLELEAHDVIDAIVEIAIAGGEDVDKTDEWGARYKNLLSGTIGDLTINKDGDIEGALLDILNATDLENAQEIANKTAPIIKYVLIFAEKVEENNENMQSAISELIINVFGADVQNPVVSAFVEQLSSAITSILNGSFEDLEKFCVDNNDLTLSEIDGYLGGKISEVMGSENFNKISTVTVGNIYDAITSSLNDSSLNGEQLLENIKNANGDVVAIIKELEKFINDWITENEDVTLGELFGDNVELDSLIANVTIGELLGNKNNRSLKLSTLDDLILAYAVSNLLEGSGM